ncbi:S-adenosyl-L-methionine-dependent methyltransferase [Rhypophila decipiens]
MPETTISKLSETIFRNVKVVDSYLKANNLPPPSFDVDGPAVMEVGPDGLHVEDAKNKAIAAAMELVDLLVGPFPSLRPLYNGTSLQAISKWKVAQKVPIHGQVSFDDLGKQVGVHPIDLRRVLRYAMCHHRLFCEPREGFVAHTLASRQLAEDPMLADGLWLLSEHTHQAQCRTVEALEKWQDQEPTHTAVSIMAGKEVTLYELLQSNPEHASKFVNAMTSFAKYNSRSPNLPKILHSNAGPFKNLGKVTVVDVGGSRGMDAIMIAKTSPNPNFIVQDLPPMIQGAEAALPPDLRDRIKFEAYNFFTPQTTVADVYIIKQCFHNWPDHYCVRIIKNQIPAMRPGTKIMVIDSLVPPPGNMSLMAERSARAYDMMMLTQTNGREREAEDWKNIFRQADERFKIVGMTSLGYPLDVPPIGLIEVVWEG